MEGSSDWTPRLRTPADSGQFERQFLVFVVLCNQCATPVGGRRCTLIEFLLLAGTLWMVGFSGAMMPRPVTTLVVTQSARRGFWACPLVTLGHVVVELAIVIALPFGLGDVLKDPFVTAAIGVVGGLFLLWMG